MDEFEYAIEWLNFAEMDLGCAKHLLATYHPMPIEIVCFHCQQAAEKVIKGLLVLHGITPPKIHNLLELSTLCAPFVSDIDTILNQCNTLNRYCTVPRYPNEIELFEYDANTAIMCAETILNFTKSFYPTSAPQAK